MADVAEPTEAEMQAAAMRRAIMSIERDASLTAEQKAVQRQQLMNPRGVAGAAAAEGAALTACTMLSP